MKKNSFTFLFFLAFTALLNVYGQKHFEYTIKNLPDSKIYLAITQGSTHKIVDSTFSRNGIIRFNNIDNLPTGVYRVIISNKLYTDFIINKETIIAENNFSDFSNSLRIKESKENKIYFQYWKQRSIIKDSIRMITEKGDSIYTANNKKLTPVLDSMLMKIYQLNSELNSFTKSLIKESNGLYVNKLLKAYLEPDWNEYKKNPEHKKYSKKSEFLKEHFFDNVDFSDSTLLNSEVFYVLCTTYLTDYVDVPSDSSYIKAVDFILSKTIINTPVYDYLLHLFINTFSDSEWEGVYIHLVDNYLLKNTCKPTEADIKISERAEILKKLKPGNRAPEIVMENHNGKPINLYDLKNKAILLMFWSSECEHCEAVMPQIKQIYSQYKKAGLEIYAVAIETNKTSWLNAIDKNGLEWINVSDLKGFESPVVKTYNAYSTPTFYLLDENKTIVAHPYSQKELVEGLQKILGY